MGDVTPDIRHDDLFGPIPREVFEKFNRECIGYIDAWRERTLHAEAALRRIMESDSAAHSRVIAAEALRDAS